MKQILIFITFSMLLPAAFLPFEKIQEANSAYQKGAYEHSALLFSQIDTNQSIRAYNMGNAYYKAKQYTLAIQAYRDAKGVDEATRLYNLGNCYAQLNRLDQAIHAYKESLRYRQDQDTQHNLLVVERRKKEQEEKKKSPKKREPKKKPQKAPQKKEPPKPKNPKPKREPNNAQKRPNAPKKRHHNKNQMTPQERLNRKELKRLMKKLQQQRMPTMIYQVTPSSGVSYDEKPW